MIELIPLVMFGVICIVLLAGFPVAFSLAGTALIFSGIGIMTNTFDGSLLGTIPNRLYGDMTNMTLVAVPLFIFMGVLLEKSNLAQDLLSNMADLIGRTDLLEILPGTTSKQQKLEQNQSLKKSLMQDLLTGKVRVSL